MAIKCPVCEREVELGENFHCPVCETDLSALQLYRKSKESANTKVHHRQFWWLLLLIPLIPVVFLSTQWIWPTEPADIVTVVVTATSKSITNQPESHTPEVTSTTTPTETLEVTLSPTTTEFHPPTVTANLNVNCRAGPGSSYSIVSYLEEGQSQPVLAVLADHSWIMIVHPQQEGLSCWVWSEAVALEGDLEEVPDILPSR